MNKTLPFKLEEIRGVGDGPLLLITGGVHGDEFEPMAAIRRLAKVVQRDSLRGTLRLIPVVNESAFERRNRMADDGLDLARTFPGSPKGTVTERIADALSPLIQQADAYIDLHTGGTCYAILPLSGYTLHEDAHILNKQRGMARAFNLPTIWGTSAGLDGRSLSVARDACVPAIYAEYHGAASCSEQGVQDYVDGCLNVMVELGMIDRDVPPSKVQHIVEDERPASGHLQILNPSPCAGYFEPAVKLGQRVEAGQRIGTVCDPLGQQVREIYCQQEGIVSMLRTHPRVEQDDSLAAILEVDRPLGGDR